MRRAALLGLVLVAAACGGSDETPGEASGGPLPDCAKASARGRDLERPAKLPADFPLPPGMVITLTEDEEPGELRINGYAPGTVDSVGRFFEQELPDAGYLLGEGDQEEFEKESWFAGNGALGQFKIFGSRACPTAVRVLVELQTK
jgi:hypothetical protein